MLVIEHVITIHVYRAGFIVGYLTRDHDTGIHGSLYFLLCNEDIHSLSVHNLSTFSHLANLDGRWGTGVARQAGLEG